MNVALESSVSGGRSPLCGRRKPAEPRDQGGPRRRKRGAAAALISAFGVRISFCAILAVFSLYHDAVGQTPPLQIAQPALLVNTNFQLGINWQSYRGVPISSVTNSAAGSDGRYNFANGPSLLPKTTNQFVGFLGFGAIPVQGRTNLSTNLSFAANVVNLKWPHSTVDNTPNGRVALIQRSAQVGAPYFGQQVSVNFGQVVTVPVTDENGISLPQGTAQNYWFPMPYTTTGYSNAPYYWSPHAQAVFATQPGTISITWQKASPDGTVSSLPPGYSTNYASYITNAGYLYRLYTNRYLVSGAPIKRPQKMFWTEGSFRNSGKPVDVPGARVSSVNVIYSDIFPKTVATPYTDPGYVPPTNPTNMLQEIRTLWFDQTRGQILAYNCEGRVFVELLGELNPDGVTRRYLGFEIVDVAKQPIPTDITVNLGEPVTAYADGRDDSALYPWPVDPATSSTYYYQQFTGNDGRAVYWAAHETAHLNDFQAHWLIEGVAGLRWPFLFDRYTLVWPSDASMYSHYVRPLVPTETEAKLTAVQLPTQNAPAIQYQDPLDQIRGKLTDSFAYYTWLVPANPAHRGLIRFTSGDQVWFERVFSWLDAGLKNNSLFANTVATNLTAWNRTNGTFSFTGITFSAPRVVSANIDVGDRILPPSDEPFDGTNYWAGYILQTNGNSFNYHAYLNPFVAGFDKANLGSIIPVNAIPGKNYLEVWWFRANNADGSQGFIKNYWPAVIGRYTLQWPLNGDEIILARNDGSDGLLTGLQALGSIYTQNDPSLPGYNPNEEHGIMIAGQAWALRDDLNITNGVNYSSAPYVLVDYTEADGRPAMRAFHVRREKPEEGFLFDYVAEAGAGVLQAPMPLPVMEPPTEGIGASLVNYNVEPSGTSGDLPGGWNSSYANGPYSYYSRFTYEDRKHNFHVYRGLHSGLPKLQAGQYNSVAGTFGALPAATAIANTPYAYYIHASRRQGTLTASINPSLPSGLALAQTNGLWAIFGTPIAASSNLFTIIMQDLGDTSLVTNTLSLTVLSSGVASAQAMLNIISTNMYSGAVNTFTNRPPHLAGAPGPTNSFTMRFYYKTQIGFAWPGVPNPPPVGTIVPYLRPWDSASQTYVGDPTSKLTASLDIVYRPVWPATIPGISPPIPLPTLHSGDTLTEAKNNLAAVRGQSSAFVLYQQSIATNLATATRSVALIDPTVAKIADLTNAGLTELPSSIRTESYQGRIYFPNLPPHLVNRLYFDPHRGSKGSLIFKGQYNQPDTGGTYLDLNVLSGADLATAQGLCTIVDSKYSAWVSLLSDLATSVLTFYENPSVPGQYIANTNWTTVRHFNEMVEVTSSDTAVDSYAMSACGPGSGYISYIVGNGRAFTEEVDPVTVYIARVAPPLERGELKVIEAPNPLSEMIGFQHSCDLAGRTANYQYEWRIAAPVNGEYPHSPGDDFGSDPAWQLLGKANDLPRFTLGGSAGVQALSDNWVTMRYRSTDPAADPAITNWSAWTKPQLAEGWIKRVLRGINPFNQRTANLFDNRVNTDVSIIEQAGRRWEGDVALNSATINDYGLIPIYETVLHRGQSLSIGATPGINYGPANDALLMAAGYLNDLYMILGHEAWANANNPTVGFSTRDLPAGSVATAMFSFQGQVASLLEQNLDLLRGRDDSLEPGVTIAPVYNRLYWNYTLGINSGEVVYLINYNIQDDNADGVVDASDAAIEYPQGHGDAYGHYLTAVTGYYSLLMNPSFDWVPRPEAVLVAGQPVSVDYMDERKFAAASAAMARAGRLVFDLTWRQDYQPGTDNGWNYFSEKRVNAFRTYSSGGTNAHVARYWGMDNWATRVGQGAYLNWVVGNAILPDVDPDPTHEGIRKIDRTTVPELSELPTLADQLQTDLQNAEIGLTPLGVAPNAVPFDINPYQVTGANATTHFEQVYGRAVSALANASAAFDDARNVTQAMRTGQDSAAAFKATVDSQERAYTNALIDVYGTPYPDDLGPGQTYIQDYAGPDLFHFNYVENVESTFGGALPGVNTNQTFVLDVGGLPEDWQSVLYRDPDFINNSPTITYTLGPLGFFGKPSNWKSTRVNPGSIQQAISAYIRSWYGLDQALSDAANAKEALDKTVAVFESQVSVHNSQTAMKDVMIAAQEGLAVMKAATAIIDATLKAAKEAVNSAKEAAKDAPPTSMIAGMAAGGDMTSPARAAMSATAGAAKGEIDAMAVAKVALVELAQASVTIAQLEANAQIAREDWDQQLRATVANLGNQFNALQNRLVTINQRLRDLDDAKRKYDQTLAQGNRILAERQTFRQKAAAMVQGYRVRDAAFRIFRNEKLQRYNTLFDLAAQYAFLAAQAYDYETGLLNTDAGRSFLNRIVASRAIGVFSGGSPQYASADTGDPGLSSCLAEMKADFDVLKGRLGFNNPDGYGTIFSLRGENYRILPGTDGKAAWQAVLQANRVDDLLQDSDARRHCMQLDDGSGLPQPGIIISFGTVIGDGMNFFGQPLGSADHNFSSSSFATKIFSVGVDFDGYIGMDTPSGGATNSSDPNCLAATPYIYLIPVGQDSMRTPPLGDASTIRTWTVDDLAIPLPFNIGASQLSSPDFWTSSDSLTEPLYSVRKHQAFRPVSSVSYFTGSSVYGGNSLSRSQYVNCRLIGRSAWNTKWKLIIPGKTLYTNPKIGLDRFINSVSDVKLYFITYSYSGN